MPASKITGPAESYGYNHLWSSVGLKLQRLMEDTRKDGDVWTIKQGMLAVYETLESEEFKSMFTMIFERELKKEVAKKVE